MGDAFHFGVWTSGPVIKEPLFPQQPMMNLNGHDVFGSGRFMLHFRVTRGAPRTPVNSVDRAGLTVWATGGDPARGCNSPA